MLSLTAAIAISGAASLPQASSSWYAAVDGAVLAGPEARVVVLDMKTGRLLAGHRIEEEARTLAAPGSTIQPIVLFNLVEAGRWDPEHRVSCDRRHVVGGRKLSCSHPLAPPFDEREGYVFGGCQIVMRDHAQYSLITLAEEARCS